MSRLSGHLSRAKSSKNRSAFSRLRSAGGRAKRYSLQECIAVPRTAALYGPLTSAVFSYAQRTEQPAILLADDAEYFLRSSLSITDRSRATRRLPSQANSEANFKFASACWARISSGVGKGSLSVLTMKQSPGNRSECANPRVYRDPHHHCHHFHHNRSDSHHVVAMEISMKQRAVGGIGDPLPPLPLKKVISIYKY
jgi:hypothetical protein